MEQIIAYILRPFFWVKNMVSSILAFVSGMFRLIPRVWDFLHSEIVRGRTRKEALNELSVRWAERVAEAEKAEAGKDSDPMDRSQ